MWLHCTIAYIAILAILIGNVLYWFGGDIVYFFERDEEVEKIVSTLIVLYFCIIPGDWLQIIYGGYIRGVGKQLQGAVCFFISFYVVGLPLAYYLGSIRELYTLGLWIGLGAGGYMMLICNYIVVYMTDMEIQIRHIAHILHADSKMSLLTIQESQEDIEDELIIETEKEIPVNETEVLEVISPSQGILHR